MKKILLIPQETQNIIDLRTLEYYIISNVRFLQQIPDFLRNKGKKVSGFKFCQFEENEMIPFFFKIKDRLSQEVAEFEIERIRFVDIPVDEETKIGLIKETYLKPLDMQMKELIYKTTYYIATERLGEEIDEDEFINLKIEKDELDNMIKGFDYKRYLNEIA